MVYNDKHEAAEINQIIDTSKDMGGSNNSKQPDKSILNKTHKNYMSWGTWKYGDFDHLTKDCNNASVNTNQFNNLQDQERVTSFRNTIKWFTSSTSCMIN